jgi:hypothetical protein
MALSIGGGKNKSKGTSSQTTNQTQTTSFNPTFQAQLDRRLAEVGGRQYQGLDANSYEQFMNPFQQEVIDAATNDINANRARSATELTARQAGSGAFGNDRRGIYEAELQGQYDRTLASTLAGLRSGGYSQALGVAQGENANRNNFQGQLDQQLNALLALMAQGNQTTNMAGTQSGRTTGSGSQFGFNRSFG